MKYTCILRIVQHYLLDITTSIRLTRISNRYKEQCDLGSCLLIVQKALAARNPNDVCFIDTLKQSVNIISCLFFLNKQKQ